MRTSNLTAKFRSRLPKITGSKYGRLWAAGLIIAAILAIYAYIYLSSRPVIDTSVAAKADFAVYAPTKLPESYQVDKDKTTLNSSVMTYVLTTADTAGSTADITVTVQPRPTGFDMASMTGDASINTLSTSVGTLYDLSVGETGKYVLDTGDSLMFFTSPKPISSLVARELTDSLVKAN